jgi:hypothetical protein
LRRAWYTGFLPDPTPEGAVPWLANLVGPLLVVVDYAEAVNTKALAAALRTLATRPGRTVVLFTARTLGDWWTSLDTALTRAGIIRTSIPVALRPRHPNPTLLFRRALRRFAARPDATGIINPPDPVDGGRWTTLDLVMLAWVAAKVGPDLPDRRTRLYDEIIDRELDHWANTMQARFGAPPSTDTLRTAAAIISVLAPRPETLTDLLTRVQFRDRDAASRVTERLEMLLREPGDGTLVLRPDPVAEHLLLSTFPKRIDVFHACVDAIDTSGPASADGTPALPGPSLATVPGQASRPAHRSAYGGDAGAGRRRPGGAAASGDRAAARRGYGH